MTTLPIVTDQPNLAAELEAERAELEAERAKTATLTNQLSAWATAAERWRRENDAHRRHQFFELLDETKLQHSARIVEDVIRDNAAAQAYAEERSQDVERLRTELADLQMAVGNQADPELLAALKQYHILHAAADDALWILGYRRNHEGRVWAADRLREGLGVQVDLLHGHLEATPEQAAAVTRRNALEAVTHAASELRAAIADHDFDSGVTWMYGPSTVYERINALDLALDALARLEETPYTEARFLLENVLKGVVSRLVSDIRMGDQQAAVAQITALIGDPLGSILIRELARRDMFRPV